MALVLSFLNATLVGLVSLFLLSLLLSRRSKLGQRSNEPPKAPGAWPIIGHLWTMRSTKTPHFTLATMADKYGPIFTMMLGSRRALVVSDSKIAKELYTTHDLAVASRPIVTASHLLSYNFAMFPFTPYSTYWRDMRKISTQELLSSRRTELLSNVRVSEVEASIKQLFKLCDEKSSGQAVVDLNEWMGELTLNAVLRMTVGKRICGDDVDGDGPKTAQRCLNALREFFHMLGLFVVGDAVPILQWLDLGGHEKAMKSVIKELDMIFCEWLEEHRQKRSSGEVTRDQDFLDVMLSLLDGSEEIHGYDAETVTKATTLVLIAGAVDTIRTTLTWAVASLLNNPHALKEAQKELDLHVGRERRVMESDLCNLEYLQAISKETLRLHPATPLGGPRQFREDCIINGYHIPKGTRLIVNLWKIHTDPSIWANPLDFKPERFLNNTHKNIDFKGNQQFEFIPFGGGRRICPGITFGFQIIHIVLASLLQSFEISKPSDQPIDMTEAVGLVVTKATPLHALIKPRISSKLYE